MSPNRETPVISAADVSARVSAHGRTVEQLMDDLLPIARERAIEPISHFKVGAVARGLSGALYLGANLEFEGQPLNASVHAEQSAVMSAWMHGERGIDALAASATPCGHCRQFLNELAHAEHLPILVGDEKPATLGALLPSSFGPRDLDVTATLMEGEPHALRLVPPSDPASPLLAAALQAADRSHAPYSKTYAGVALGLDDGSIRTGRYAESAAFNPSLSPLQVALSGLALETIAFARIRAAALVESAGPVSQRQATETLLASLRPGLSLLYAAAATER